MKGEYKVIEYIESIIGIIVALMGICTTIYKFFISKILDKKPFEQLQESLEKGNSIVLPEELKYQIKNSIPQKFINDGKELSLKGVEKKIWKLSGNLYAIIGMPAAGKTTAMRNLYCKMARKQKRIKCIFFNMGRVKKEEDLRDYLSDLIIINKLVKNNEVIAFFDGVDEAISFIGNDKLTRLFFEGAESEIFSIFREKELNLRGMVFGLRTEFIDRAENGLKSIGNTGKEKYFTKSGNYYMEIFKLKELSNREVVKVYKSLKILKAYDKNSKKKRHQEKYPNKLKDRIKYLKFFKKILNDKDSIFYYPMYVRYAYIYMQEYKEEWNPYRGDILMLSSNIVTSLEILVKAIIKWEFHIYILALDKGSKLDQKIFYKNMQECLLDIIKEMVEENTQKISRVRLKEILESHSLGIVDEVEKIMPVFSHCLMVSNEEGNAFGFSHFTFYEYFLARYLIYKADYEQRKKFLVSGNMTENFLHIYYGTLYLDKDLGDYSVRNIKNFSLKKFINLETTIEIIDRPKVSILEIHEFLPYLKKYIYWGHIYTQKQLEEIRESKILDITHTGWDSLEYAKGIVHPKYVEKLDLCGLPLKNIDTLKDYKNLKWLDMRFSSESTVGMIEILNAIRGFSLQWICVNTNDGRICGILCDMVKEREVYIEKIYANTPDYSEAHKKIYRLKQQIGQEIQFYICKRSDLAKAKAEYKRSNDKKDSDLLKALFELEADEDGILGLKGKEAEATLWNGLSLAEYFLYRDRIDEDRDALNICSKLEQYIPIDDSRLSFYFGRTFGKALYLSNEYSKAKRWFLNTWNYSEKYLKEELQENEKIRSEMIDIGLYLYKDYVRCKDEKGEEFGNELLMMIKEDENYEESSNYLRYLQISIGYLLDNWKKGEDAPQGLMQKIQDSCRIAEAYADKNNEYYYIFSMLYFSILYANRKENLEEVTQLLDRIQDITQKQNLDETNRNEQGGKIKSWEQKIYYLFLKGDKKETIKVIDELIDYPYRNHDKDIDAYHYIREACLQNLEEDIDKHKLWGRIWY